MLEIYKQESVLHKLKSMRRAYEEFHSQENYCKILQRLKWN